MSFWNLVAELGMPIAATVGLGAFIMVIIFLRFRPTGFSAQKGREDVRLDTH